MLHLGFRLGHTDIISTSVWCLRKQKLERWRCPEGVDRPGVAGLRLEPWARVLTDSGQPPCRTRAVGEGREIAALHHRPDKMNFFIFITPVPRIQSDNECDSPLLAPQW